MNIDLNIRFAEENELDSVNEIRRQVFEFHGTGVPVVFKSGFTDEEARDIYNIWKDPKQELIVALADGAICGFAVLKYTYIHEDIYMNKRDFLEIDEFGVARDHQRQGVAKEMVAFIRKFAEEKGFQRIELTMWEFNQDALAFYEAMGFKTYRRYMEMTL